MHFTIRYFAFASYVLAASAFAQNSVTPIEVKTFDVKPLDVRVNDEVPALVNLSDSPTSPSAAQHNADTPATPTEALAISFQPKQYSAVYESEYQGREVKGTRSLMRDGEDWLLKTSLKKLVVSVSEEARVHIDKDNILVPKYYEYKRSIFGIKKRQTLDYDYSNGIVNYKDGDDTGNYPLLPHTFDKASQQFLIEEHLRRGSKYFTSNHAARNRNKVLEYRVLGEEYIELPVGVTKAIKVEIVPDANKKRHTVMWFDPERNCLLVQLNQTDKNGNTYTMKLSDVKFLD